METNTQNEMPNDIVAHQSNIEASAGPHTNAEGIVIDPNDPNTVDIAVLGHLYSANTERGVYKTTDGGAT